MCTFRPISIDAVLNGWIVRCGCQVLVYQDRAMLVRDLDAYLLNPEATERHFIEASVNARHTGMAPAEATSPLGGAGENAATQWSPQEQHDAQMRQLHNQAAQARVRESPAPSQPMGARIEHYGEVNAAAPNYPPPSTTLTTYPPVPYGRPGGY